MRFPFHPARFRIAPGPDCRKVITFYNNFTDHAVFPVIQAGIQNPDPWLQALLRCCELVTAIRVGQRLAAAFD